MDGDVPFVTGDIPVELVVIFEESNGVEDAILEDDGFRGVLRAGYPNFELQHAAVAFLFVFQGMAIVIGDGDGLEEKRIVEVLRRVVLDRNGAVDAVPGADEAGFDDFGDVDRAVGIYRDGYIETLNREFARLGRRRDEQREGGATRAARARKRGGKRGRGLERRPRMLRRRS